MTDKKLSIHLNIARFKVLSDRLNRVVKIDINGDTTKAIKKARLIVNLSIQIGINRHNLLLYQAQLPLFKPGGVIATNTNTSDNGEFIIPSMFQRMK